MVDGSGLRVGNTESRKAIKQSLDEQLPLIFPLSGEKDLGYPPGGRDVSPDKRLNLPRLADAYVEPATVAIRQIAPYLGQHVLWRVHHFKRMLRAALALIRWIKLLIFPAAILARTNGAPHPLAPLVAAEHLPIGSHYCLAQPVARVQVGAPHPHKRAREAAKVTWTVLPAQDAPAPVGFDTSRVRCQEEPRSVELSFKSALINP